MNAFDREEAGAFRANRELERGRERYQARAWSDAYRALSCAEQAAPLAAPDLELLATAAYLIGNDAEYLRALERAHRSYLDSGDAMRASRCAFWLGFRLWFRGEAGQASGWFGFAQRLLERAPGPSIEEGYVLVPVAEQHLAAGENDEAYAAAQRAVEVGEYFGDADLIAMARQEQGRARLQQARLEEGLALLDETMVLAVSERLSPVVTGLMYCSVVQSCQRVFALGRAREWTAALEAWCDQHPEMVAFSGICRVHRAEVLQLGGAWTEAVAIAQRACERTLGDAQTAAAFYQLGELHRLKGAHEEAEQAYRNASQRGLEPQPGLALLRLAQGNAGAAAAAIRRAVRVTAQPWQRARLLPASVEILLANGDLDETKAACSELDDLARELGTDVLTALAAQARGAVEIAEGNAEAALPPLRAAGEIWRKIEAPYLVASVRVLIGLSYRALGDDEGAELELDAARTTFEKLGAISDLRRIDAFTRRAPHTPAHGLTARELEVLRLVADGMTNRAIADKLFVSERTIDRHVSNIFTKLGVSSRAAATAFAYQRALF
jgi:DNA-binding CsgD family transcriptional regulator